MLDTIPRTSEIGEIASFVIEDVFSIPITKHATSFTDTITISNDSVVVKTVSNYLSGDEIRLTVEEILRAYNSLGVQSNADNFTITVTTYNGDTIIGTDSVTVIGSALGTSKIKANGEWKRGLVWIKTDGEWKRGVSHTKDNGVWHRGI